MMYEKKMLILSGDGKGVVLIEKSGRGIKFALRTFDMPPCAPLKAGIVTKRAVYVRDLPYKDNPAAVIEIALDDIDSLHFAIFDRKLRLYGCTGKRMWESNLMDLLLKHERRAPMDDGVNRAALPPITQQPRVLPLPDGTGIPQSRLAVYGDDALADSDFYTHIDMSKRMPAVDSFLSEPRVLDALAPRIIPVEQTDATPNSESDAVAAEVLPSVQAATVTVPVEPEQPQAEPSTAEPSTTVEPIAETAVQAPDDSADNAEPDELGELEAVDSGEWVLRMDNAPQPTAEAAATTETEAETVFDSVDDMPWEMTARWIKRRSGRELRVKKPTVKPATTSEQIKHLRTTRFFERARHDIDLLFANAPRDEALIGMLDDVEWVKVDVDGNTISVGRSGNVFLCYAVAGNYERTSPLGDEAQWLPAAKNAPTGKGYWLIFQNMATGEIMKS